MNPKKIALTLLVALALFAGCAQAPAYTAEYAGQTLALETRRDTQYTVCATAQDPQTGAYAVVVHSVPQLKDGTTASIPPAIQVQTFDSKGRHTDSFDTGLQADAAAVSYADCQFTGGMLTFYQSGDFDADRYVVDTTAETAARTPALRPELAPSEEALWQAKAAQAREGAARTLQQGDWLLAFSAQVETTGASEITAQLLNPETREEYTTAFSCEDPIFTANLVSDRVYTPQITLDPQAKTASLRISKLTYLINFATGEAQAQTAYRVEDLEPRRRLAISPSGNIEIYATHYDQNGRMFRGELVAYHHDSGEIVYLGPSSSLSDAAVFIGEDILYIDRMTALSVVDTRTGEAQPAPQFDYGSYTTAGGQQNPEYITVGIAYDPQADRLLVAYRSTFRVPENVTEQSYEVFLAVFDRQGQLLETIETGLLMPAYGDTVNRLELTPDGAGAAILLNGQELGYAAY